MKIRKPWLIKWIGFFGALVIRLWLCTLLARFHSLGIKADPRLPGLRDRFIYIFWHENILLPCFLFRHRDVSVLISQHADGEMIAQVCRHMGYDTIRGSSTRGGIQAMRQMLRHSERRHIVVIPDGPRGPRRHVEMGVVYLAAKTGLPIIPAGIGYARPWRLGTWDRFAIPRPWTKARVVTVGPIHIPANVGKEQMEHYRQFVQNELDKACTMAEEWANR